MEGYDRRTTSQRVTDEMNRMKKALNLLKSLNKLSNDYDAYLFEIAQWGLGEVEQRPDPDEYL